MTEHAHISHAFDTELTGLRDRVLSMGALVEERIADATLALTARDAALAQRVIDGDEEIDRREVEIDEECVHLIAQRQPVARDLRLVAATLKIVVDLERIGDLAVNMAERALRLCAEPPRAPAGLDLGAMSALAQGMLRDALDAFVTGDVAKARRVLDADDQVDALLVRGFAVLTEAMQEDPGFVTRGVALLFFAKQLERVADHTTNVAEMVIYLVRGKDVRHGGGGAAPRPSARAT